MKILVVRLSSLGDILHLFPAISDLRRRFPQAEIHWLVEPAFAEMAGWHAAVDKVIAVPLRAHKKTWWRAPALLGKVRRQLRSEHYDIVLDAQGLLKSAVLARLAGVPVAGFAAEGAREPLAARLYRKTAAVPAGLHVIEKNRQLVARLFDIDIMPPADFGLDGFRKRQLQSTLRAELAEMTAQPYLMLLHGTTWDSKYWPESSWQELIRLLTQAGWRCLLPWGNEEEHQRAQRLQVGGGSKAWVLPRLALTELMNVVLRARAFVSVETGIGHLAAALDVPGVMLHGPTDPEYSGILDKSCRHLTTGIDCTPCFKRDCPRPNLEGIPPCQLLITPQQVYQNCLSLLAANGGAVAVQNDKIRAD
ncbi:MAG TPA: lipopolysaccharide heptosyltransferase I [Gallionella sp.]|nr:lipopolysaccharide heptosyltransferase I [Gallionella sp.]